MVQSPAMYEIDFPLDASGASASRAKHFNFADPGPLPESLTNVPGFLSALTDWTMERSHSPNRTLAFSGALAALAHLSGRFYTDSAGTRTNLYVIALAPSGSGKEAPRTTNNRLLERLNDSNSLIENVSSGEALEDNLHETPSLLLQSDEIDKFFGQMRGQGILAKGLSARLRTLFTSSGVEYKLRKKANDSGSTRFVTYPHLTVYGSGEKDELLDGLSPHEIKNGLFGRCLILAAEDENIRRIPQSFTDFPPIVLKAAEYMVMREHQRPIDSPLLWISRETDDAREAKEQAMAYFGKQRRILAEADMKYAKAIVARIDEKISKLALLHAISRNAFDPVIDLSAVKWAVMFSAYVIKWMLYESQFHLAEGRFGKLMEKAKAEMSKCGGAIAARDLLRALHCDAGTLSRVVSALLLAEEISKSTVSNGKTFYTLIN